MKIYKVYINLFNWESNIEFNTKYFIDKKLALNYKDKLENWRVRFVKILKIYQIVLIIKKKIVLKKNMKII